MNKLILLFIGIVLLTAVSASGETVAVRTKNNALRKECAFFAPVTKYLQYGNVLEVVKEEGDWLRAKSMGVAGCIHSRAVSDKTISYNSLNALSQGGAMDDEVSLAGKGFTPEIEKSFTQQNPGLQFYNVNTIEALQIPDGELLEFMRAGGLNIK